MPKTVSIDTSKLATFNDDDAKTFQTEVRRRPTPFDDLLKVKERKFKYLAENGEVAASVGSTIRNAALGLGLGSRIQYFDEKTTKEILVGEKNETLKAHKTPVVIVAWSKDKKAMAPRAKKGENGQPDKVANPGKMAAKRS